MKKKNRVAVVVAVLVVCALAVGLLAYFAVSARQRALLNAAAVQGAELLTLSFNGQTIAPTGGSVADAKAPGRTSPLPQAPPGVLQSDTLNCALTFALPPDTVDIQVRTGAETVFSGTLDRFQSFVPPRDGEYEFLVSANYTGASTNASCEYRFTVTIYAPAEFWLSADVVSQGGVLVLQGKNLRTQGVEVTLPYGYTPHLTYSKTGCVSLIPFNFMRDEGAYTLLVRYDGQAFSLPYTVTEHDYPTQHITVDEGTVGSTIENSEARDEYNRTLMALRVTYDDNIYWNGVFQVPIDESVRTTITTEYGNKRYINDNPNASRHAGIDIACDEGTPVMATAGGRILFSGFLQMTGNSVLIDHGMGLMSMYLHMSALSYTAGEMVGAGEVIGAVGSTGFSTGPHLHFELTIGGHAISPWDAFDGSAGFYVLYAA